MSQLQIGTALVYSNKLSSASLSSIGALIRSLMHSEVADSQLRSAFDGREVSRESLQSELPEGRLAELCACGLLVESGQQIFSPFRVHLVEGFIIVTDPDVPESMQDELYLDPLWEAPRLAKLLIRDAASQGLDMGCGCGVLSLVMSTFCDRVTGVDINPRAIEFARLNSALNDVSNVIFIESDLFEGLQGQFDRVVFSSPTDEEGSDYRDLLECGEPLLARFFLEVGNYLTPASYLQVNFAMNDYPDSLFSERLAAWIKASNHDLRWITMICKRFMRHNGIWKRGWATFARGGYFSSEVDWPYPKLAAAGSPGEVSRLVLRLLENHELLNAGTQRQLLRWSEGISRFPVGNQTLGLWDVPLAEVPEDILRLLTANERLSYPTDTYLDPWIELCLRKGLLETVHNASSP